MPDDFHFEGGAKFAAAVERWVAETLLATAKGTRAAAQVVIENTRANINSQSGTLAASITSEVKVGLNGYEAQIGPQGVVYARKVELGKHRPNGAQPHPYLQPGFEHAMGLLTEPFAVAWREALPKG